MLSGTKTSNEWVHEVINYVGPNNGDDFSIYHNGNFLFNLTSLVDPTTKPFNPSDGRIVIGRIRTDLNIRYASVQVDELLFFNQSLTEQEIMMLSQSTT